MDWAAYTEACRRLSEVHRTETERQARDVAQTGALRSELDRLKHRLTAQRDRLTGLGRAVSITPSFGGVVRSGVTDVGEALRLGFAAADQADVVANTAEERARQPWLLPGLGPMSRNLLVYICFALAWWLVGVVLWLANPETSDGRVPAGQALWNMLGLPSLALFSALATIRFAGRPRISDAREPRARGRAVEVGMRTPVGTVGATSTGDPSATSHILGGLICYLGINLAYCFAYFWFGS